MEGWQTGRKTEKEGHGYVEGLTMLWAYREVETHGVEEQSRNNKEKES